jgi:hypothetical protein
LACAFAQRNKGLAHVFYAKQSREAAKGLRIFLLTTKEPKEKLSQRSAKENT